MALTDSLDAATQQVLALLAQLKTSNCRLVWGPDTGAADAIALNPIPAVTAYGPDLLLLADVAHPNATTTPTVAVSALGPILITDADGTPVGIGQVRGKCLFALSSAAQGGWVARLLVAAAPVGSGEGIAVANGQANLAIPGLTEEDTIGATDLAVFHQVGTEGGLPGGHARKITMQALAVAIVTLGGARLAGQITTGDLAFEAITAYRTMTDNTVIQGTGAQQTVMTFTFNLTHDASGVAFWTAFWGFGNGPSGSFAYMYLDGNQVAYGGGGGPTYQEFPNLQAGVTLAAGQHTIRIDELRSPYDQTNSQSLTLFVGSR